MGIKVQFVEEVPASQYLRKRGPKAGRASKYAKAVKMLKANPGRWAHIQSVQGKSRTTSITQTLRQNGLEIAVRKAGGGWYKVYSRYNPK